MSKNLNIYLDDGACIVLEELKKNPEFNFSQYIQNTLKTGGIKNLENPDQIKMERIRKENEINVLKNEVEFLNEKERKLRIQLEAEESNKNTDELRKAKKRVELINGWKKTILEMLNVIDDSIAENLAVEYYDSDRSTDLLSYCQLQGKKFK